MLRFETRGLILHNRNPNCISTPTFSKYAYDVKKCIFDWEKDNSSQQPHFKKTFRYISIRYTRSH